MSVCRLCSSWLANAQTHTQTHTKPQGGMEPKKYSLNLKHTKCNRSGRAWMGRGHTCWTQHFHTWVISPTIISITLRESSKKPSEPERLHVSGEPNSSWTASSSQSAQTCQPSRHTLAKTHSTVCFSHMMERSYYSHHNHVHGSEQPEKKMFLFCQFWHQQTQTALASFNSGQKSNKTSEG